MQTLDWDHIDRTSISQHGLNDADDDAAFWLERPILERLAGIEHLRRITHGDAEIDARVQRVLETSALGGG